MGFAIPLAFLFIAAWSLIWSYGMKSGFAEKQLFRLGFFSRMLGLLPIHTKSRVDLGTWNIVFFNNLKKIEALQKINFSSSEKCFFFFSRMLGVLPIRTWNIVYQKTRSKGQCRALSPRPQVLSTSRYQLSYGIFDFFSIRKAINNKTS